MGDNALWSVRMRASGAIDGIMRHLSGAERLVDNSKLDSVVIDLLNRAKLKSPDSIQITVDPASSDSCEHVSCLPVHTVLCGNPDLAAEFAVKLLISCGISHAAANSAIAALTSGLGTDGAILRGASLWDNVTGERLEPNKDRGVRASRFDYSTSGEAAVIEALASHNLTHFRTREALAVATKVIWSGVTAELCWSDEPEYSTGYVATRRYGYVRLPNFKPADAAGGRIFFVNSADTDIKLIEHRLQRAYVLIEPPLLISQPVAAEDFIAS